MKKRLAALLTVVALMMVMLAMSVAPAFAATLNSWGCRVADNLITINESIIPGLPPDRNDDGKYCQYINLNSGKSRFADNHLQ